MTTVRNWLRANNYEDIAAMIDDILREWAGRGVKTRRNWWLVLAGGRDGRPRTIEGRVFPVLQAAQIRMGVKVTPNAVRRSESESAPPKWTTGRWS